MAVLGLPTNRMSAEFDIDQAGSVNKTALSAVACSVYDPSQDNKHRPSI